MSSIAGGDVAEGQESAPSAVHGLDATALDAFVREHHDRLVRLAALVCLDRSEAVDAVQTALEQAWRRRDGLRDAAGLRPWLDRIVVREAIRQDRRRRSALGRLLGRSSAMVTEVVDQRATLDPTTVALDAAFETLPVDQRVAVVLHLHIGYSVAETADMVGAPAETVRSRLRIGKERLRVALEDGSR